MAEQVRDLSRQCEELAQQSAHSWPANADQTGSVGGSASALLDPAAGLEAGADVSEEQFESRWDEADHEQQDTREEQQAHSERFARASNTRRS